MRRKVDFIIPVCIVIYINAHLHVLWGFPGGSVVRNTPASAEDAKDMGSIPGSGRSHKEEIATHSSILDWKIPWTVDPGGL